MRRSPMIGRLAGWAAASLLLMSAAGCTVDGDETPPNPPTAAQTPAASSSGPAPSDAAGQTFGSECPNFPSSGEGSLQDLAQQDWVTALAMTPALSQWSVITTAAGLQADFAEHGDVTVFVPVDGAFKAYGTDRIRQLLINPQQAGDLLRYHVVTERLSPEELAGTHQTLAGRQLEVTGSGQDFEVDGEAMVVCGNLQTANATIYLVDRVLTP